MCKRLLHFVFILFIVIFGFSIPLTAHAQTVYPLQSKFSDIMMYKSHTSKKVVALTFDDGPDERFTPPILDVLNKYNITATFFLLGTRVEKYPNVANRIVQEGDRKSTRLNSSHVAISYAVFCLKKKK